ncbi:hypothetical protein B0A67_21140 [Flavobacterium aquidurense]|uniref:hypothetical protein n=1 Tax=Flavobacterium aquidurense TaxID=362413 RepID=UPI000911A345|nr:hypothetical protein [Flavobacterium aquidurense]OXA68279.1 hypothetical protein B0A67_21140 [Flavobacterium aquidurense]SHH82850.1 hypothetical protein SAMN05444481_1322 [Flavobacterium frigidimaris]
MKQIIKLNLKIITKNVYPDKEDKRLIISCQMWTLYHRFLLKLFHLHSVPCIGILIQLYCGETLVYIVFKRLVSGYSSQLLLSSQTLRQSLYDFFFVIAADNTHVAIERTTQG